MGAGWAGRTVTRARKAIRAKGQVQSCWRCGQPIDLDREQWHAGHIVDRALGGGNEPSNLAPEHAGCSTSAGGRLGGRRAAAKLRVVGERTSRTRRW